jgi:hypothetical protein
MVWVSVLGHAEPVFPYQYPTVISLPLALLVAMALSLAERARSGSPIKAAAQPGS